MEDINYRVIAFDPGGTTGWASYSALQMPDGSFFNERFDCGQLGPKEHHKELYDLLLMQRVSEYHVVSESFEFRNRARDGLVLISKEYIGVMKLFAAESEVPLVMQTAAMGKGFISDSKIMRAQLWHPGWRHAMDATRHLLYYLVTRQNRMDLVEKWWKPV